MAGHRRKTGRPKKTELAATRRRERMIDELNRARTTGDRLTVAMNYARSCLSKAPNTMAAEELIAHLIEVGDAINRQLTR